MGNLMAGAAPHRIALVGEIGEVRIPTPQPQPTLECMGLNTSPERRIGVRLLVSATTLLVFFAKHGNDRVGSRRDGLNSVRGATCLWRASPSAEI